MRVGLVTLDQGYIHTPDSLFDNLHGWWEPPSFVTQFWCNACYISYSDGVDFDTKAQLVRESYNNAVKSFWALMPL